ncbi:hypothetical protein BGW37DRAFT_102314 [Umbelopsis sp. PMI_123]|nr:hypothetical protein BGW37DRAFT_102314 [Umbelopsis sp. PMI_123]
MVCPYSQERPLNCLLLVLPSLPYVGVSRVHLRHMRSFRYMKPCYSCNAQLQLQRTRKDMWTLKPGSTSLPISLRYMVDEFTLHRFTLQSHYITFTLNLTYLTTFPPIFFIRGRFADYTAYEMA